MKRLLIDKIYPISIINHFIATELQENISKSVSDRYGTALVAPAHGKSIGANNSFAQHRRFVLLTLSSRGMFFKFRLFATLLFDRRFRYLICVAFFDSMSSRKSYGLSFRFCGTHT